MIRKARPGDALAVAAIYDAIHAREEAGQASVGWARGVYPTLATAQAAIARDDLFVMEQDDVIIGAAIINQQQVDVYAQANWRYPSADDQVMVLHTLVIHPAAAGHGYGRAFVQFYEDYARAKQCPCLRMDTNARNERARAMYAGLGYEERGEVPCVFNGIAGVGLVLLEKKIEI